MKISFKPLAKAFSLIEMMVAMTILSVLMYMLTLVLDQVQEGWRYSESRISQFREARVSFDLITKNLGQSSLNTYWDLKDDNKDGLVDGYFRTSELHFKVMEADELSSASKMTNVGHAVAFQGPLGFSTEYPNLNNLFNGRAYFVGFGGDKDFRPSFISSAERFRYRLMEFRPPAEANQVFEDGAEERAAGEEQEFTEWFRQGLSNVGEGDFTDHLNPLAENIVTLLISPRDSIQSSGDDRNDASSTIAPNYIYDSSDGESPNTEQQVPPLVRVTMIAIDEASAVRLENGSTVPEYHTALATAPTRTRDYDEDIAAIVEYFDEKRINHKVFSSMVLLRSAKWSERSGMEIPGME
jgi:uncharacterized protein (TIGR02599 family)